MVKQSREVRVVILKSDVPGMFCAGADLKERPLMTEDEVAMHTMRSRRVIVDLAELPVPVISAMDGTALGGGLEVAMATDIRVAGEVTLKSFRFETCKYWFLKGTAEQM